MLKITKLIILTILLGFTYKLKGEVAIIVHPTNANNLNETQIRSLFLGKLNAFPNGEEAVPVVLASSSAPYKEFLEKVIKKNDAQLKSYWAQRVFTGSGSPPKEVKSSSEIITLIKNNPNLIGFIPSDLITKDVKVIEKF